MKKKIGGFLLIFLLGCLYAGCHKTSDADTKATLQNMLEQEDTGEACIYIRKDNTFTDVLSESFQEEYYDLEELKTMLTEEIAEYNEANPAEEGMPEAIKLVSLEQKEDRVNLVLTYGKWDALVDYSAEEAFAKAVVTAETVTDAVVLQGSFVNTEGETVTAEELQKTAVKKGYHQITVSGQEMTIYLEHPVACTTDNVTVVDEYTVQVPVEESVIITY